MGGALIVVNQVVKAERGLRVEERGKVGVLRRVCRGAGLELLRRRIRHVVCGVVCEAHAVASLCGGGVRVRACIAGILVAVVVERRWRWVRKGGIRRGRGKLLEHELM